MEAEAFDIRHYEKTTKILKTIAIQYPESSEEYQAIEVAARALLFACETRTWEKFEQFLGEFGKKFSPKQIDHLQRMGLIDENLKPVKP
jgi:DNA replication protein DnaD